jgi:hypothetical protein
MKEEDISTLIKYRLGLIACAQGELDSVYKCAFSVMPALIRHPEAPEKTGFRLSPE